MAAADVVICRAGAMTITELAIMGKAAIIIPSVNVTDGHQLSNAKALSSVGAAVLVEESQIKNGNAVSEELEKLYSNPALLKNMCEKVKDFAIDDVDDEIFEVIESLLKSYKKIVK